MISKDEYSTGPKIQYSPEENKIYTLYNYISGIKQKVFDCSQQSWGEETILLSGYSNTVVAGFIIEFPITKIYFNYWDGQYYNFYMMFYDRFYHEGTIKFYETGNSTMYTPIRTTADNRKHAAYYYMGGGFPPPFPDYSSYGFEDGQITSGLVDEYFTMGPIAQPNRENVFISYTYYFINNLEFATAGNNRYYFWSYPNGTNLNLKVYNAVPLPPASVTLGSSSGHPRISWNRNPDADISNYKIYKKLYSGSYSLYATVSGSITEFIDLVETVVIGSYVQNETVAYYKVVATDISGLNSEYSNEVNSRINGQVPDRAKHNNSEGTPTEYALEQNYPNPFNPITTIRYQIPQVGIVHLTVYDILGKEVAVLVNKEQNAGSYTVTFDGSKLASGVYIYKLSSGTYTATKKLNLLK